MESQVEPLLSRFDDEEGTIITAWYDGDDGWKMYSGVITTALWEIDEIKPTNNTLIVMNRIPVETLWSFVPDEVESMSGEVTVPSEVGELSTEFSSEVRLQYRMSQEMGAWGHRFPALCLEHWMDTDVPTDIDEEDESALLDSLDSLDISLAENMEYIGSLVMIVEDRRCRVTYEESSSELLDQWRNDDTELSEDELLAVMDGWTVTLRDLDIDAVDLSLRREEYGNLLYETEIPLTAEHKLSRDDVLTAARNCKQLSMITVRMDSGVSRYCLPSIAAPGASDEFLRVSKNGRLLDEQAVPIMRQIGLDVTVGPTTSSPSRQLVPPVLYDEPAHMVGRRAWDQYVSSEPADERETWVVDEDGDFDEVMEIICDELTGCVKLSEPYLSPDFLKKFIRQSADDLDLWVALGHDNRHMGMYRSDFEDCVTLANRLDKDVHILWIPKSSKSPLHDRFLLNDNTGLMIGTSFNSLDSNLTVVTEISRTHGQDLERHFDRWWTNSKFQQELDVEIIDTT